MSEGGDWICSDPACLNVNFPRRTSCNRCKKERADLKAVAAAKKKLGTEIGKSAADKSRGLFSADDWQCSKCTNVNWARRQTCNVCNAPKFGEVEARTGYGGGYNERGVVEYRRREDSSDDEFDEFGRRKKKKRTSESTSNDKIVAAGSKSPQRSVEMQAPATPAAPASSKPQSTWKASDDGKSVLKITPKVSGCLSDGSICDYPIAKKWKMIPLTMNRGLAADRYAEFDKFRKAKKSEKERSSVTKPKLRGNAYPERSTYVHKYLDYEPRPKKSKTSYGPNSYLSDDKSSTKNEVRYKFKGKTPSEDFEVVYTLEERIRAAALAIAYNNCKTSADEFETFYDKPAPNFKTVYAWRKKLLTFGCLNEMHIEKVASRCSDESPPPNRFEKPYVDPRKILCGISARQKRYFDEPLESKYKSRRDSVNSANDGIQNEMYKKLRKSITERYVRSQQPDVCNVRNSRSTERLKSSKSAIRSKSSESYNSVYPITDSEDDNAIQPSNASDKSSHKTSHKSSHETSHKTSIESIHDPPKSPIGNQSLEDINSESEIYDSDKADEIAEDKKEDINKETFIKDDFFKDTYECKEFVQPTSPIPQQANVLRYEYNSTAREVQKPTEVNVQAVASSYEYIPTKIDAKEISNYKLFKDNIMKNVLAAKFWSEELDKKNDSLRPEPIRVVSPGLSVVTDADWDVDDDALYKDTEKDEIAEESFINPPSPPHITAKDLDSIRMPATHGKSVANLDLINHKPTHDTNFIVPSDKNIVSVNKTQLKVQIPLPLKTCDKKSEDIPSTIIDEFPLEMLKEKTISDTPVENDSLTEKVSVDIAKVASLVTTLNLSGINAEDLLKALANIQQVALIAAKPSVEKPTVPQESPKTKTPSVTASLSEAIIKPKEPDNSTPTKEPPSNVSDRSNIPFLDDIFDPGPVELELSCETTEPPLALTSPGKLVAGSVPIGSFKSFALPKPVILNRLKLVQGQPPGTNPVKPLRKGKKKASPPPANQKEEQLPADEEEDEDSEEGGDLSKYDLWGSDSEQADNKTDGNGAGTKTDEPAVERPAAEDDENNGKSDSPDAKETPRRSRSSSPRSQSRSSSTSSSSSSSSVSKCSANNVPSVRNKYDDFNLNSERENSPVPNYAPTATSASRKKEPAKERVRPREGDAKRRSRSRERDRRGDRNRDAKPAVRSRDRGSAYPHRPEHRGAVRERHNTHGRPRPYHAYGGRQR